MGRFVFAGTRIVRLTMRFCLAPTSSSPSSIRTGRLLLLSTCSSGTRPASEISVTSKLPTGESFVQRDVRRSRRRNARNQGNDRQSVERGFKADKYISQRSSNRIRQVSLRSSIWIRHSAHSSFHSNVCGGYDRAGHLECDWVHRDWGLGVRDMGIRDRAR